MEFDGAGLDGRFGVRQRTALDGKGPEGAAPHVLHMTATPIPRTLSLTAYGDLSAATTAEMTIEIRLGGYSYTSGGTWDQKRYGWKLKLPWAN